MQHVFFIIKFNPYGCCEPVFLPLYFFLLICYVIIYRIVLYRALKLKPENVDEEDIEKLLTKKNWSRGLAWASWTIIFWSLLGLLFKIDIFVDYYFLFCFAAALTSLQTLQDHPDLLAPDVDWSDNSDPSENLATQKQTQDKSVFKTMGKVTRNFYKILPGLTIFTILFGLNSPPPLEVMSLYVIGASLLIAALYEYVKMRAR